MIANNFTTQFLEFIAARKLMIARSAPEGRALSYAERPRENEYRWEPACGRAVLHSFTWTNRPAESGKPGRYNIAWVELEEGPRLISTVETDETQVVRIGMPLNSHFREDGKLVFVPAQPQEIT